LKHLPILLAIPEMLQFSKIFFKAVNHIQNHFIDMKVKVQKGYEICLKSPR
jgi:hypothetical protein